MENKPFRAPATSQKRISGEIPLKIHSFNSQNDQFCETCSKIGSSGSQLLYSQHSTFSYSPPSYIIFSVNESSYIGSFSTKLPLIITDSKKTSLLQWSRSELQELISLSHHLVRSINPTNLRVKVIASSQACLPGPIPHWASNFEKGKKMIEDVTR